MLKPCPSCNREVSSDARSCPQCGKPIQVSNAEKFVAAAWGAIATISGFSAVLNHAKDYDTDPYSKFSPADIPMTIIAVLACIICAWGPFAYLWFKGNR